MIVKFAGIPCPPLSHPLLGHPDRMLHPLKHEMRLEIAEAARAPLHQVRISYTIALLLFLDGETYN